MLTHAFSRCSQIPVMGGRVMDVERSRGNTNTHWNSRKTTRARIPQPNHKRGALQGKARHLSRAKIEWKELPWKHELRLGPVKQGLPWTSYNLSNLCIADSMKFSDFHPNHLWISNIHCFITTANWMYVYVTFLAGNDLRYKLLKWRHQVVNQSVQYFKFQFLILLHLNNFTFTLQLFKSLCAKNDNNISFITHNTLCDPHTHQPFRIQLQKCSWNRRENVNCSFCNKMRN